MKLDSDDILELRKLFHIVTSLRDKKDSSYEQLECALIDAKFHLELPDEFVKVLWAAGVRDRQSFFRAENAVRSGQIMTRVGRPGGLPLVFFRHMLVGQYLGLAASQGSGRHAEGNPVYVLENLNATLDGECYFPEGGVWVVRSEEKLSKDQRYRFYMPKTRAGAEGVCSPTGPDLELKGEYPPEGIWGTQEVMRDVQEVSSTFTRAQLLNGPIKTALNELRMLLDLSYNIK